MRMLLINHLSRENAIDSLTDRGAAVKAITCLRHLIRHVPVMMVVSGVLRLVVRQLLLDSIDERRRRGAVVRVGGALSLMTRHTMTLHGLGREPLYTHHLQVVVMIGGCWWHMVTARPAVVDRLLVVVVLVVNQLVWWLRMMMMVVV